MAFETTRTCPICNREGLLEANGARVRKSRILHENEHFQHWKIGDLHFLTKTQENIREELEDTFYDRELVLN